MLKGKLNPLAAYAWAVTAYNIMVILWGAFVRASGSGAGCGSHWPLCNGEVLPKAEAVETAIEFTHRVTSGLAFLLVLGLLVWIIRRTAKGSQMRWFAWGAMIFMISESLVGAGLVLFEWVAGDTSLARVIVMGVHLTNTLLLLFTLTLTAWLASGRPALEWGRTGRVKWLLVIGFAGMLVMSAAGAVTALGDTLFPAATLAEGIEADFSPRANLLVQLRVWHPVLAVFVGFYLYSLARHLRAATQDPLVRVLGLVLMVLFGVQLMAGALNLVLLVPVGLQIVHLFLATLVWVSLTLLFAARLSAGESPEERT